MFYKLQLAFLCIYTTSALPQQPEINDQFEVADTTVEPKDTINNEVPTAIINDVSSASIKSTPEFELQQSFTTKIYKALTMPIVKLITAPKVNSVLRNIGICIVNGAMEIISYYFPAPLIPLIASAAGMMIPFEPVVMLKEKMPVTSYRRAFRTAMDSFMGTFDKYKIDDVDPYMTRRFHRRLNYDSQEKDKPVSLNKIN